MKEGLERVREREREMEEGLEAHLFILTVPQ
jgi:hypothetical protein